MMLFCKELCIYIMYLINNIICTTKTIVLFYQPSPSQTVVVLKLTSARFFLPFQTLNNTFDDK